MGSPHTNPSAADTSKEAPRRTPRALGAQTLELHMSYPLLPVPNSGDMQTSSPGERGGSVGPFPERQPVTSRAVPSPLCMSNPAHHNQPFACKPRQDETAAWVPSVYIPIPL